MDFDVNGLIANMEIETKTASLETFSVTIKALHVNNKQMTLAVFRQLEEIDIYNEDGSLKSFDYWGYVKYRAKGNNAGEYWVVASFNGNLFKSEVKNTRKVYIFNNTDYVSKSYNLGLEDAISHFKNELNDNGNDELDILRFNNEISICEKFIESNKCIFRLQQLFIAV